MIIFWLITHFFEVRECQLRVSRAETDAYAAIMDQYLASIMRILRQEMVQVGQLDIYHTMISPVFPRVTVTLNPP